MYTKDKSNRITLRLNDEQFAYVKDNADMLGVSPSEFLRMVINSTLALSKKVKITASLNTDDVRNGGGIGRENDKADINDLV